MKEIFKYINGFPGYMISNKGRVKSLKNGHYLMKPYTTASGYHRIALRVNGKHHGKFLHRLVAEAFCPKPLWANQVNHLDGNKLNNNSENLEWCNDKINHTHAKINGLKALGESNGQSKLTRDKVITAKSLLSSGVECASIAKQLLVSPDTIRAIKNGRTWKHVV